jgi:hypothetical protein
MNRRTPKEPSIIGRWPQLRKDRLEGGHERGQSPPEGPQMMQKRNVPVSADYSLPHRNPKRKRGVK